MTLLTGLIVISGITALVFSEGALRLYQYLGEQKVLGITPSRTTITWQDHPIIGKVLLTPNTKGWFVTPSREYYSYIQANSEGFNDFDHSILKPDKVYRILFLGDSFVASLQTPLQQTFFKQVERTLNEQHLDKKIEVLAMGLGDSGSAQQFLALREIGIKYKPDLVIQMFLTANDLKNNYPNLQKDPYRPYFEASEDGTLKLIPHFRYSERKNALWKDFFKNLRLVELFLQVRQKYLEYKTNYTLDYPIDYHVYNRNYNEDYQKAWEITQKLILETKALTENAGGKYLLVPLANNEQINKDVWLTLQQTYPNLARADLDLEKPDNLIMGFCKDKEIDCLEMLPVFKDFAASNPSSPTHYHFDGHWNQVGTNLTGEFLSKNLYKLYFSNK